MHDATDRPAAPGRPAAAGSTAARRGRRWLARSAAVVGEVLITAGVLVGLFAVWQVWWTDVAVGSTQSRLVADLEDRDPEGDAPSVLAEPGEGVTFATLRVPRWGEDYVKPISQGVSRQRVLDVLGIGHYPGTAMPGGTGNFALAGHRMGFGHPFRRVEELEIGDPLVVRTAQAWYVYRVTSTAVVPPTAVDVLAAVPGEPGREPDTAQITLTTCHPLFSTRERFVVHGVLDSWQAIADGPPDLLSPVAAWPPPP